MKQNTETTKFERLRMLIGTFLAIAGVLVLFIAGAMLLFSNVTLIVVGMLLVASGLLIAGSTRLAAMLQDLLGF